MRARTRRGAIRRFPILRCPISMAGELLPDEGGWTAHRPHMSAKKLAVAVRVWQIVLKQPPDAPQHRPVTPMGQNLPNRLTPAGSLGCTPRTLPAALAGASLGSRIFISIVEQGHGGRGDDTTGCAPFGESCQISQFG